MKKLLCKIFGHKINSYLSYRRYFRCESGAVDGIGRQHIVLKCECDRCGEMVRFGYIHGNEEGKITR